MVSYGCFIKGYYMSINPILIYVNKKRQIKLALFYSVVAIALGDGFLSKL